MEWVLAILLLGFLGYLVYDEMMPPKLEKPRGTLVNSVAAGSVYEPVSNALRRGIRVLEIHLYSDEDDQPVVATGPVSEGTDHAYDNVSFESVCVDITNDAFPSKDPCILSIVSHTEKSRTLNIAAKHLKTIPRRHLVEDKDIVDASLDSLANKLVIVSGGNIHGTELETLTNLNWNNSNVRRLSYTQAVHPEDPEELSIFTKSGIVLVASDGGYIPPTENPNTPLKYGCQWNFYLHGPGGFSMR